MGNTQRQNSLSVVYIHPKLGPIKRIEERKNKYVLCYEVILENQKLYDDWEFQLTKINQISDDILFLPIRQEYNQTNICGSGGLAKMYYEDYLYSLHPQIVNRSEIKRPFNEQELMYLFYSLVKIEYILESNGKWIGDIKPENILVNEDGYIRVISHYSWPGEQARITSFQKDNDRYFLSPEQCEERFRRKDINSINKNQSEVFSIGMTILEAGTLKDCTQLYGYSSQYRLNQAKIREYLSIFESRYSRQLYYFVRDMLAFNPHQRVQAQLIYRKLYPYQYNILNLQEIEIQSTSYESIPRVDREQKISIKKFGESQVSHQQDIIPKFQSFGQHLKQSSHPLKISLNPHHRTQNDPFSQALQSGYHQSVKSSLPSVNYQLVNENTNFPTSMAPHQIHPNYQRHILQNSLPINVSQYEQNQLYRPHYVTLNSMVENANRGLSY